MYKLCTDLPCQKAWVANALPAIIFRCLSLMTYHMYHLNLLRTPQLLFTSLHSLCVPLLHDVTWWKLRFLTAELDWQHPVMQYAQGLWRSVNSIHYMGVTISHHI